MKISSFLKNLIVFTFLALAAQAVAGHKIVSKTETQVIHRFDGEKGLTPCDEAFAYVQDHHLHGPVNRYKPCRGDLKSGMCDPDDLLWMPATGSGSIQEFMIKRPNSGSHYCGAVLALEIVEAPKPAPVVVQQPAPQIVYAPAPAPVIVQQPAPQVVYAPAPRVEVVTSSPMRCVQPVVYCPPQPICHQRPVCVQQRGSGGSGFWSVVGSIGGQVLAGVFNGGSHGGGGHGSMNQPRQPSFVINNINRNNNGNSNQNMVAMGRR